jgi:hypothetical protein
MNTRIKVTLGVLAGFGLGAIAVQGLHAQAKPPAYVISEIDVTNPDAYTNEYVPLAKKALADSGQKSSRPVARQLPSRAHHQPHASSYPCSIA